MKPIPLMLHALLLALLTCAIAAPATAADKEEKPQYDPEEVKKWLEGSKKETWETSDGVYLELNYWSPPSAGTTTPVAILLHDYAQDQRVWFEYASMLFKKHNMAVVTFDFRGHGKSIRVNKEFYRHPKDGSALDERDEPVIDFESEFTNKEHYRLLFVRDLLAVKRFIVKENNASKLNVRTLGLVSAGPLGALVALEFATNEFAKKDVWVNSTGDLTAMVMLAPSTSFKGVPFKAYTTFDGEAKHEDKLAMTIFAKKTDKTTKLLVNMLRVPDVLDKKQMEKDEFYRQRSGYFLVNDKAKDEPATLLLKEEIYQLNDKGKKVLNGTVQTTVAAWLEYRLTKDKAVIEKRSWEAKKIDDLDTSFGGGR